MFVSVYIHSISAMYAVYAVCTTYVLDRQALTNVCAGCGAWGCWCIQHVIYVRGWGFGRGDFSWKGGIVCLVDHERVGKGKGSKPPLFHDLK
jgi:hypothetical protein